MMRRFFVSTFLFAWVFGARAEVIHQSSGEINSIDQEKKSLVISIDCDCGSGRISDTNFKLTDRTKILLNGRESKLEELKTGDQVDIDYEKTDAVKKIAATR
jgi:hypothetical protein